MGCGGSVPASVAAGSGKALTGSAEAEAAAKAAESAARLAAMMAELGLGGEYTLPTDRALVGALQRQWYGTTLNLTADLFTPYLQATVMVAAAGGLKKAEKNWLKARTLLLGLSEAQSNQLLQFDCGANSMNDV